MDLLFKRYANPFLLLDIYLDQGRLLSFVKEFLEINNEVIQWEFYLAKVFDLSWEDYQKELKRRAKIKRDNELSGDAADSIIHDSENLLNGFSPE